jgi:hypothetical protein
MWRQMLLVCGQTLNIKTVDASVMTSPVHLPSLTGCSMQHLEHSKDRMWVLSLMLLVFLCELSIS